MPRPFTALLILGLLGPLAMLQGAADNGRIAWRYQQNTLTVHFRHLRDREWVADRSDGKRPSYSEIERSGESVTLQNQESKLFVRLHPDRAFWRRPNDRDWTPWVKGEWVAAPPPTPSTPISTTSTSGTGPLIRIAYFVPRDRQPVASYEQKIRTVLAIVSEVYLQDLRGKGYQTAGLRFEGSPGEPTVRLLRGDRPAAHYNAAPKYDADEQWRRLLPEIRSKGGDTQRQVLVVFAETYDEGPAEHLWPGVIARGAYYTREGGLAVFSAHLLKDEFCASTPLAQKALFFDQTPVRGRKAWGHRMDTARCEFVEDGTGAVAHELGHALGLPHDRRDDARDIMGNGFRNLRWNLEGTSNKRATFSTENAQLLMSSPYLAADLTGDRQAPTVAMTGLAAGAGGWTAQVRASDETGLRSVVFVDRNGASVFAGRKLSGASQSFRQLVPVDPKTGSAKVLVILTDNGGNQARKTFDLRPVR